MPVEDSQRMRFAFQIPILGGTERELRARQRMCSVYLLARGKNQTCGN
jgi:hypothetical protein